MEKQKTNIQKPLIISYKEDGKLKFASHTDNHKWKSLYNYIREGGKDPVRIYKM